jgi:hypothetical protein
VTVVVLVVFVVVIVVGAERLWEVVMESVVVRQEPETGERVMPRQVFSLC